MKAYIAGVGKELELTDEYYIVLDEFARKLECLGVSVAVDKWVIQDQMLLFRRVADCAGTIDFVFLINEPGVDAEDIGKSFMSKWLSRPLKRHAATYEKVEHYCEETGTKLSRGLKELAKLPEGCIVIDDCPGIVPVYAVNAESTIFFFLPPDVNILSGLLEECVLPVICGMTEQSLATEKVITYRNYVGALDIQLDILLNGHPARWKQEILEEETHITLTAAGATPEEAKKLAEELAAKLIEQLQLDAWRESQADFAGGLKTFVKELKVPVSVAFWCGEEKIWLALEKVLLGSFPSCINGKDRQVREKVLGVPAQCMEENGGVNPEAAMYMAANVIDVDNTPLGLSILMNAEDGTLLLGLSDGKQARCDTHKISCAGEKEAVQSVQRHLLYFLQDTLCEYPEKMKDTISLQELLYSPGINVLVSGFSRDAIRKWVKEIPLPGFFKKYRSRI